MYNLGIVYFCAIYIDFVPTVSNQPETTKKNRTGLIVGLLVGVGVVGFLSVLVVFHVIQRRKCHRDDNEGKEKLM